MFPEVKGLYKMSLSDNRRRIGEYDVLIPDKPKKDTLFRNYKKSIENQKFQRIEIPPDLRTSSDKAQKDFIDRCYHKRKHGEWWLIKDTPVYICGLNWFYLNFWWCEYGGYPDFRIADIDHFQWWVFEVVYDPLCYGGVVLKCRREGMTEKALCEGYEHVTRVRNAHFGMQNMTDDDVAVDYDRVVDAHEHMIWFFKPVNKGSTKPVDGLIFDKPSQRMNKAKIEKDFSIDYQYEDTFESLMSKITFAATTIKKYDGQRLARYRQGEFGKILPSKMNIVQRHDVVKPCMHMYNGRKIIGKELWESTAEELGDGEMLERTIQIIDDSRKRTMVNGQTKSGMKYLFRNALDTAEPDEWGFPLREQTRKDLEAKFKRLEDEKDWQALSDLQRKNPITEAHALTPSINKSPFNTLKLTKRLQQLNEGLWWNGESTDDKGRGFADVRRRGDLVYEQGQDSRVIFVDNPNGRWWFSQVLNVEESNKQDLSIGGRAPGNKAKYRIGVDPVDAKSEATDTGMSDAACVVYRMYDTIIDGNKVDEEGNLIYGLMETDQPVATYCERPDEPDIFYEEMIKVAVYFGCEVFYEAQKPGIRNYFRRRGYYNYLMFKPDDLKTQYTVDRDTGAASSEMSIGIYVEMLIAYVNRKMDALKHPELITDGELGLLTFQNNKRSRQRHDLVVAFGFCLLATTKSYGMETSDMDNNEWLTLHELKN